MKIFSLLVLVAFAVQAQDPTTAPSNPSCAVCGDVTFRVQNQTNNITFEGEVTVTCAEFAQLAYDGFISEESCPTVVSAVTDQCGCEQVPIYDYGCAVCGFGFQVQNETNRVSFPGFTTITCEDFAKFGLMGFYSPEVCATLPPFVAEECGCEPQETLPPEESGPCPVCGVGFRVENGTNTFNVPGQPTITCDQWANAGLSGGYIANSVCPTVVDLTVAQCGCEAVPDDEKCFVCGEGFEVENKTNTFQVGDQSTTCEGIEIAGLNGLVEQAVCALIPVAVTDQCGCVETALPPSVPAPVAPPVAPPTSSPAACCNDDRFSRFFVQATGREEPCVWLAARIEQYRSSLCQPGQAARNICPETCGVCTDAFEDTNGFFDYKGTPRNCLWLSLRNDAISDACRDPTSDALKTCPETCDLCNE